jgi:hypothetical protein
MNSHIRASLLAASLIAALAPFAVLAAPDARRWVRVEATADRFAQASGRRIDGADYGRFQWLAVDDATLARLQAAGLAVREFAAPFELDLGGTRFDPLQQPPSVPAGWDATSIDASGAKDLHLVQFGGPVRQSDLDALRSVGVEPLQYIHPFTYVVWSDAAQLQQAAARPAVRWSGDFLPAYRVLPQWRALSSDTVEVHIAAYRAATTDVAIALRAAGVLVNGQRAIDRAFSVINAHVPGSALASTRTQCLASVAAAHVPKAAKAAASHTATVETRTLRVMR